MPTESRVVDRILHRIRPPTFPRRAYDVLRFGADPRGRRDSRPALVEALRACHGAGGGHVLVPSGTYGVDGPIHLLSNVDLHLGTGATVRFGTNPEDFLPPVEVRWEGTRCYNYSPLVYAYRQTNVAITGRGTLDGQARKFWGAWKSKQSRDQHELRRMGERGTPLGDRRFGSGHYLRPGMFEPYRCRNVLVEGVTFRGSPFWTIHPVFCTNVTVRGVRVLRGTTNDDGCDPDSCTDVLIEDCTFDTADDHVAIKAGRDRDAWGLPGCENVVVRRCAALRSHASAYSIGSEMSGGVRNVVVSDCTVGRVRENAVYVKSNSDRGGTVENVWFRDIRVGSCGCLVRLQTDYKRVRGHPHPPRFRNLRIEDLACRTAREFAVSSVGTARQPIESVTLQNVRVRSATRDLLVRHTVGLSTRNLQVNGRALSLGDRVQPARSSRSAPVET
jgi:polygalacturonase